MIKNNLLLSNLLVIMFLFFFFAKAEAKENFDEINSRVDEFLQETLDTLNISGLAVATVKDGEILMMSGYGTADFEWDTEVTENTTFQIASSTKLLTSTLFLKAMYEGKIGYEDNLSKYLNDIPEIWKPIKIKHLISHSSGIKDYKGEEDITAKEIISSVKDSTLEFETGTSQKYVQTDFMMLGIIFEKIYGKPFFEILQDEVIKPLNMNDGGYDMEKIEGQFLKGEIIKQKAYNYYFDDGEFKPYKYVYPYYLYTAAGYYASVNDMAKWAIGLDNEILFPKDFSYKYIYENDGIGTKYYTFSKAGWVYHKQDNIIFAGHSGGPGIADILRFPEYGYTFIVLSNDGELLPELAQAIASFYIDDFKSERKVNKFERFKKQER